MPLTTCAGCRIRYPEGLLAPYVDAGTMTMLCGICALERINAKHGTHYFEFYGDLHETRRKQAVAFRASRREGQP